MLAPSTAAVRTAVQSAPVLRPPTLVLNADGRPLSSFPLSLWPWQESVRALCRDRVEVAETWPGQQVRSPSTALALPRVVMLRDYAPLPPVLPLSRLLVALRDRFCCQYCGERFPLADLTFDHVVPRTRGGQSTWDNLVMACGGPTGCNTRKADALASHSSRKGGGDGRFRPLRPPTRPDPHQLYRTGLDFIPAELRSLFAAWLPPASPRAIALTARDLGLKRGWHPDSYWTVELEP